ISAVKPGCSVGNEPPLCRTFSDLPNGEWGQRPAETLSCMCVMQGYPDGTFGKDQSITKAEFIKVALRIADENINFDTVRVAVPEIGVSKEHWASGYIDYANNNSMLELLLNDQGDLEPDAPITRQEVAYL